MDYYSKAAGILVIFYSYICQKLPFHLTREWNNQTWRVKIHFLDKVALKMAREVRAHRTELGF